MELCETCDLMEKHDQCKLRLYTGWWIDEEPKSDAMTLSWDNRSDWKFGPKFGCVHHSSGQNAAMERCKTCVHKDKHWLCNRVEQNHISIYRDEKVEGPLKESDFGADDAVTISGDLKSYILVGGDYGCIHHSTDEAEMTEEVISMGQFLEGAFNE